MAAKIFPHNIGPNCENALRCFFDLSPLEVKVYRDLLENGPGTAVELGRRIERDRSTAYRSLSRLVENDLAVKAIRNREGGGIFHVYEAVEPEQVQLMLRETIDNWYEEMQRVVKKASEALRSG
ncbi:MAG: helix-turn-helix domain-containing protein [Thermoplasmatota archaeon]